VTHNFPLGLKPPIQVVEQGDQIVKGANYIGKKPIWKAKKSIFFRSLALSASKQLFRDIPADRFSRKDAESAKAGYSLMPDYLFLFVYLGVFAPLREKSLH
jgi:hypothetical protein